MFAIKKWRGYVSNRRTWPYLGIAFILYGVIALVYYPTMFVEKVQGKDFNEVSIADKIDTISVAVGFGEYPGVASQLLILAVVAFLLFGSYCWFNMNEKRIKNRVKEEREAEKQSVLETKNEEIKELKGIQRKELKEREEELAKKKKWIENKKYNLWAENHGGESIAVGTGGLNKFCTHLISIMHHRTIDGLPPNGASAFEITGIKLATNTPLLFSLQQGTEHHNRYTPDAAPPADHWVRFFCTGFRSALRGLKDELKHFEWIYLYPNIIRSQLGWFPFQGLKEYEKWANDHEVFLNRVEEDLPEACKESMWHRETSMIPLVIAIIDFKNVTDGSPISKVIVGLANLVHSERSARDPFEEARLQAKEFPWFHSSSEGIVEFFKQYHDSLGYRDIELMQAIEKLLTQAGRKNLDIIFHQRYSSEKHAHLGDLPEGLKPQSLSYVPIKTERRT